MKIRIKPLLILSALLFALIYTGGLPALFLLAAAIGCFAGGALAADLIIDTK